MNEQIILNTEYAEARVYYDFVNPKHQHVYLVKISFTDAGFHINSITVQPSPKNPNKLWVQPPRFNVKGTWVWPLQIEKSSDLRQLIETLALKAVDDFSGGKDDVYWPTDDELENVDETVSKGIDDFFNERPP